MKGLFMSLGVSLCTHFIFQTELTEASPYEGKLAKKGHNYRVYDNGTLEFSGIEKQDEADYKCKAKNLYGMSESEEVEVVVEAAAEIKEFPENTEVAEGEKLELQCAATGDPPPIISWLKNGQQVSF